jgi:type I restriction-modification system DNA methylase subunit
MSKQKVSPNPTKSFERFLWDTATKLLGNVGSWEYKHVVLSLIFLKIDSSLAAVEKNNYFSRLGLDGSKLSATFPAQTQPIVA